MIPDSQTNNLPQNNQKNPQCITKFHTAHLGSLIQFHSIPYPLIHLNAMNTENSRLLVLKKFFQI